MCTCTLSKTHTHTHAHYTRTDLLSSGFVYDLFSADELDNIFSQLRADAKAEGVPDTRSAMLDFFIQRTRANLHVILCFSPVGEDFRVRSRKFPALINCTTIDWFHPWPRDALESVAFRFLGDISENGEQRVQLSKHMATVHISVKEASERYLALERRHNYTTPKSFLEFISFYQGLLSKKRSGLNTAIARLEKGLTTLAATTRDVAVLQSSLNDSMKVVREKSLAVNDLIGKMGVERKKVEDQQAVAAAEAKKAKTASDVANKIAGECQKDLDAAMPIMEKAKKAVNCLSKANLTTLKSFAQPPGHCVHVTNACMILRNFPGKRDWPNARKMMKDVNKFLESLKNFDATNIDDVIIKKVEPILELDFFTEDHMKSSSEAAANLCGWVVNIVAYNKIYKNVAPKVAAKIKAEEELALAQTKVRSVELNVAKLQKRLKEVTDALMLATDEKNVVEAEADKCKHRMGLAKRLVDGLANENTRWLKSVQTLKARKATLIGDGVLSAAFVCYSGAFNQTFRSQLWKETWTADLLARKLPLTEAVDPLMVLASDTDFASWKNEGLRADRTSLENGAIISQCSRWPLMIDPQLQGIHWVRNHFPQMQSVQAGTRRWLQTVVLAVSTGACIIMENVGQELDATLSSLLSRSLVTRGGMQVVQIGNEDVQYDAGFLLLLQVCSVRACV